MSDVAELTATGSAPATEAVAPETPAQPAPAVAENLSPKERARARGRELDRALAEQARQRAQAAGQPREAGKFVKQETTTEQPAADAAGAVAVSESEPPKAQEAASEADGGPAEGFERVFYPEGHPLRQQGVEYDDVPKSAAMRIKALLNGTYTRRQEVEQAIQRAQALEERLARMEAENRFRAEHASEFWTAEDQAFYEDAREKYGEQYAERYRQSRVMEAEQAIRQRTDEAQLQVAAERITRAGQEFRADALAGLPKMYPGLSAAEINTALDMYAHELDQVQQRAIANGMSMIDFARKFGGYNETDFFAVAKDYIESRPGVIAARSQSSQASEVERNRIRAEIEAQERAKLQDASRRHALNPNRNLGGASVAPTIAEPETPPDFTGKSMVEIKKGAKARIIERYRQRVGA